MSRRNEIREEKIGCAEFYFNNKDNKFELTFEDVRWDEPHDYGSTTAWEPMGETNIIDYAVNGNSMSLENLEANLGVDRATALIDEALENG